jgi:inner membrane protein
MGAHAAHLGAPSDARLSRRSRLLLGGIAAAFPDVDFIGFLIDPLRFLAYWHQGPTHSLLLLPL